MAIRSKGARFPRTYLTSRQTVLPISWFLWISILRIHSFMSDTFHSRSVKAYGSFFDFLEMFFLVFSWFGDILICWQNSHEPLDFSLFLSFLKTSRLTDQRLVNCQTENPRSRVYGSFISKLVIQHDLEKSYLEMERC